MAKNIYKVNQQIDVVFQTLGGTEGITDLTMKVYAPNGSLFLTSTMTEESGAIYIDDFTPDSKGRWWVKIFSASNPENSVKESYFVADQDEVMGMIIQDADGNQADVTENGRLKVSQEPPEAPVGTTSVSQSEYGNVAVEDDLEYLIPNGETLTLQRFSAGAQQANSGNVVELWYDPNGNGVGMTIIDTIFCNGASDQHDLNQQYIGNGTRKIRMRRKRLSGGAVLMFGNWEGYY